MFFGQAEIKVVIVKNTSLIRTCRKWNEMVRNGMKHATFFLILIFL